jgi:putative peptide zinc metalloprotease protein
MTRYRDTFRTRTLAVLTTVFALVALAAPAGAGDRADQEIRAVNETDGTRVEEWGFDIRKVRGDVTHRNAAFAYASCENCASVALAFQVLFVRGEPNVVKPENVALAVNEECQTCETTAYAYQGVFGVDGKVRFTREARHEIRDIRDAVRDLAHSGLPSAEIDAQARALTERLRTAIKNGLVDADSDDDDDEREGEREYPDEDEESREPESDDGDDD